MTWEEFILKVRCGNAIKTSSRDYKNWNCYVYSIPINDTVKMVYEGRLDGFYPSNYDNRFLGMLDCNTNKFYKSSVFTGTSVSIEHAEQGNVEDLEDIINVVNNLLISLKCDDFMNKNKDQYSACKELKLNDKTEYDDIQLIGMGVNNYIRYHLLKKINSTEYDRYRCFSVATYLNGGLEQLKQLKYLQTDYHWDFTREVTSCMDSYKRLSEKYSGTSETMVNQSLKRELAEAVKDKGTVTLDGEKIKVFSIDDWSSNYNNFCYYDSKKEYKSIDVKDVNLLEYRGKVIYNGQKELKRLMSVEYQKGIRGLIEYTQDHFEDYGRDKELTGGDLIYTKNGHFGIVTGKDDVYLDNGQAVKIDDIPVSASFQESELNPGLGQVRKYLYKEYNYELEQKVQSLRDR